MTEQRHTHRPQPGDTVRVIGRSETYAVIDVADPALVTLQNQAGKQFRVGWKVLERVDDAAA